MIRTTWQTGWYRWTCALVAGLMAGMAAPTPALMPQAVAGVANQPKIYVFPYQGVFGDVPKEILTQTSDLLKSEIKHSNEVQLQKGPIFIPKAVASEVKEMSDKELKQAQKMYEAGAKAYASLQLDKAIKSFTGALDRYEKSLALLDDFDPVVNSLLMLSVCYYRKDKEDEGAKMLVKVIRLRPELTLDPEKYPPMFRNTMDTIRKRLLRKTRGELEVVANADKSTVFFDGKKVGTTPILLKDLVPGEHYVRVEKEGLQTFAAKSVIVPTKKVRVAAALGGVQTVVGPLGDIAEAIGKNQIDKQTVSTIQAEGKKVEADFVVIGGLAKVGGNYKVGSYLINVASKSVCPLPEIQFDPDLLGASVEVFNMAAELFKRVEGCAEPTTGTFRVVQTAVAKKTEIKAVAVGPAVPPPSADRPPVTAQPAVAQPAVAQPAVAQPAVTQPARGPAQPARGPAQPARGPAQPAAAPTVAQAQPAVRQPAPPVVTTQDGLATAGSSAIEPRRDPIVVPQVPRPQYGMPIIKDEDGDQGPKWYRSWWFWTLLGAAAVGGAVGGMYAGGVFDAEASGASVDVNW